MERSWVCPAGHTWFGLIWEVSVSPKGVKHYLPLKLGFLFSKMQKRLLLHLQWQSIHRIFLSQDHIPAWYDQNY
jgi:hypothetical protein